MTIAAEIAVGLVAALHLYFLTLEMFLWKTPFGRRTFGLSVEQANATAILAANQGLYNGFLAAGLLWALGAEGVIGGRNVLTFFLICVIAAGLLGGFTASKRILAVQALPGVVALALVWAA
jgi:putative membrane protein